MPIQTNHANVIFRRYKNEEDIIALFPDEEADPHGNCMSYMHVGQHGAADLKVVDGDTDPASEPEYRALKLELERIGYILTIVVP